MRDLVSGLRLVQVIESELPALIFPFVSTAMYERSTLLFGARRRSRPRNSMPSSTDAFGALPLKGTANTCIVRPLTGNGLSSASRISAEDAFAGSTVVVAGALVFGAA